MSAQARAEIERLTACLARANDNHEKFERLWYLAQDERDAYRSLACDLLLALNGIAGHDELMCRARTILKHGPALPTIAEGDEP